MSYFTRLLTYLLSLVRFYLNRAIVRKFHFTMSVIADEPVPNYLGRKNQMTFNTAQMLPMHIAFADQFGAAFAVTPDAAPTWSTDAAVATLVVADDGMSAVAHPVAAGDAVVHVDALVGGVAFHADFSFTLEAFVPPPPVLVATTMS